MLHVVTGGAYNGKSAWVRAYYQLEHHENFQWISAYQNEACPKVFSDRDLLILEGIEQWILGWINTKNTTDFRSYGQWMINNWAEWELRKVGRTLVIIGTDISKGIVPMDKSIRTWRDVTGWFYQDLVKKCNRLDLIWYGIQRQLK